MLVDLYRFLGRCIPTHFLKPFFWKRAKQGKEIPERQCERFGHPTLARPSGFLVWIHGASVGELASVRSVIEKLLAYHPSISVLITSGTVASAEFVKPWLHERCLHQFVPYDLQGSVQGFLSHWRPDLTLWVESELWPTLIHGIKKLEKPAFLLNGRMSYNSFRKWKKTGQGIEDILSAFSSIFAQSPEQAKRFQGLGAPSVQTLGHLKLVNPPLDIDASLQDTFKQHVKGRPWIMAASTHTGEEKMLFEIFHSLKPLYPELLMVVAPRHPGRASMVKKEAEQASLKASLHSKGLQHLEHSHIYIIDKVGLLGTFYALHPLVFIGGTLVPVGGHNFVEAFQLGAMPFVGPHMHKQTELTSFFSHILPKVKDEIELASYLKDYLSHPSKQKEKVQQAQRLLEEHKKLLDQLMSQITVCCPHDA